MLQAFNSSTEVGARGRGQWISEFKAILVYKGNSRILRAIQRNPVWEEKRSKLYTEKLKLKGFTKMCSFTTKQRLVHSFVKIRKGKGSARYKGHGGAGETALWPRDLETPAVDS